MPTAKSKETKTKTVTYNFGEKKEERRYLKSKTMLDVGE